MTGEYNSLTDPAARASENEYYSAHAWCLNPVLKLDDLIQRFDEEIRLYKTWAQDWQRRESVINFYLFAASISCIVDDYVFWRPWEPGKVLDLLRNFRFAGRILLRIAGLPYTISSRMKLRTLGAWKDEWNIFLEDTCRLLVTNCPLTDSEFDGLRNEFNELRRFNLPRKLLQKRMRIMEGYRRQDLTHHDLATLADRFAESCPARDTHILVIGPRTAGTYFAPVVKGNLEAMGFHDVRWFTFRPRRGLFPAEKRRLRRLLRHDTEVVIVDDYSNTGLTFRLVQESLAKLGVRPDKITLLAPLHPTKPDMHLTDSPATRIIRLEHKDLYKTRLLEKKNVGALLRQYLGASENVDFQVEENEEIQSINARLWKHYKDSFQARLKRIYQLNFQSPAFLPERIRVLGKSVGWGWLGYHAYLAAGRLKEFVPDLIGLRDGILYTEWIDGRPMTRDDISGKTLVKMGSYIASRSLRLPVGEDPRFESTEVHSGWLEIVSMLKRPYVSRTGILKRRVLHRHLRDSLCPRPCLVDGQMSPRKWIVNDGKIRKTDFEHHNFGEPELDVVDPAYDLAIASFEFEMSAEEEAKMVAAYEEHNGDRQIRRRLFLYKLLYASHVKKLTLGRILEHPRPDCTVELNRRYIRSWNALVYNMNEYNGELVRKDTRGSSGNTLFFLDLDDVFDFFTLGFPHTTPSGLKAVSLLHAKDFTIIPNTGRSTEHVYNYCAAYGFPYGIGEYGGVFVSASGQTEISLVDGEARRQLEVCKSLIGKAHDVFIDPTYRHCIRAYRYSLYGTEPLTDKEAQDILRDNGLDSLNSHQRPDATYFTDKHTDKGAALEFVRDYLGCPRERTYAIGDSDVDVPMLRKAGHAFAPKNCSPQIRELAVKHECRVVPGYRQRGLLDAVNEIVTSEHKIPGSLTLAGATSDLLREMILCLTARAEQSRARRIVSILKFNSL